MALLPPLATVTQLGALLGQDLSGRLDQATVLLDMASNVVRGYTKQDFTLGTTTMAVPLRRADPLEGGHLAEVVLPQRPVIDVTEVLVDGLPPTDWWWRDDRVYLPRILWRHGQHRPPRASVTYEHGFDPIPGNVSTIVLQSAARVLVNPSQIRSEVVGGVSTVYAVPVGGEALGVLLTKAEREVLNDYRRRGGTIRVRS